MEKEFNEKVEISKNKKALWDEYWNYLSSQEKKAFLIAQNHLGSSFHIEKSNGFNDWLKKR